MIHVHALDGCAPAPLAHYLKALGILRLVAEQADPQARGWWDGDRFRLATVLDREALEGFFRYRYEPTPLVAPWNKGSGFFYPNDPGLTPLEASTAPRFRRVREGLAAARALLHAMEAADAAVRAIKAEAKAKHLSTAERTALRASDAYRKRLAEAERHFKMLKADLIPDCRLHWRGPPREWLDAALVLDGDGTPRFPALLGTGGNDGRFDFTNNFMQRLDEWFDCRDPAGAVRPQAREWGAAALWGGVWRAEQVGVAVGQYLPGQAGGANSGNGPDGDSRLNPADFVLMLEGVVLFTVHASRRCDANAPLRAAAPFAVPLRGAGYASAAEADESMRGEQWMPLWSQPLTLAELRRLLGEGRAQIGARAVREPLDLARAVARLGTARGIAAFQRFGYIERNGQSNLAVPLGRYHVPERTAPVLACLDDLEAWLPRLRREAHAPAAPARLRQAERCLADALFAVTQHPGEPARWQRVLFALADVEAVMVTGSGYRAGPVPVLRPDWAAAADDGSAELRLALAFALQGGGQRRDGCVSDGVRRHWLPLAGGRFATSGSGAQTRLLLGPERVLQGRDGLNDAIALVERRLIEAAQRGTRRLPLVAATGAAAASGDLAALIAGALDPDRTLTLARALMALDAAAWAQASRPPAPAARAAAAPDGAWLVVRLALLPWKLADGPRIGADPAIVRRLASGDAAGAVTLALRRLHAAGIHPAVRVATVSAVAARRWAAALAFPITRSTARRFAHYLDPRAVLADEEPAV